MVSLWAGKKRCSLLLARFWWSSRDQELMRDLQAQRGIEEASDGGTEPCIAAKVGSNRSGQRRKVDEIRGNFPDRKIVAQAKEVIKRQG